MQYSKLSRRQFLSGASIAGATFAISAAGEQTLRVTPPHIEGPFYPVVEQADKDADLTVFGDSGAVAKGEIITVQGHVLDESNTPIADAVVDVWQANAAGRYAHERDPNPAPLDPHFQGWAIIKTDAAGRYKFKTVKPGAYPVADDWTRPPHIHFKVSRRGFREITTQMYFEDEPLNDIDRLLNELPADMQSTLIATRQAEPAAFEFNVVLTKV